MTKELLQYFNNDELAANVWLTKYAAEGEKIPTDMFKRLSKEFYRIDKEYQEREEKLGISKEQLSEYGQRRIELTEEGIYHLFDGFKYVIPQGGIMSQLGVEGQIGSISNCFVIGDVPADSYSGICAADEQIIQLMKRRGGVGLGLSTLRPKNTPTSNAAKSSTGSVSFTHRFSNSTKEVAQEGRRGALMLNQDINHPDALEFITVKKDLTKVTGANISVKIDNKFMECVVKNEDYFQTFPTHYDISNYTTRTDMKYNVLEEHMWYTNEKMTKSDLVYIQKVNAKELWNEVIKTAHAVAEPGILFWDNIVNYSPDGIYEQYRPIGTNPCGEIPMQAFDACRLIAVNFFSFITDPFTEIAAFDLDKFYEYNYEAMRLSDDVVSLELEHIVKILRKIKKDKESPELKQREKALWETIWKTTAASRRTGLGFTALADTLAALNFPYDSDGGIWMAETIMKVKLTAELDCTIDMAIQRGTFKGWDAELEDQSGNEWYTFIKKDFPTQYKRMQEHGRRNVSWSTVAPTGSVSICAQVSSAIEPIYLPFYKRRKKVVPSDKGVVISFVDESGDAWQDFTVIHPKFKDWLYTQHTSLSIPRLGISGSELVNPSIWDEEMLTNAFKYSPWYNSTANDISWKKRVEMQATIQKYITHSISSTINLPKDVSEQVVSDIYMEAWKQGLKGITVYRDGSRTGVLVDNKKKQEQKKLFDTTTAPKRPKKLECKVVRFNNNYEKWISFVGLYEGKPYEIFTGLVSSLTLPFKVEEGFIVRTKQKGENGKYDFHYGKEGESFSISTAFREEYWNYAKLISGNLRHGMPLQKVIDIIDGLIFQEDHINTWRAGVIRALRKFLVLEDSEDKTCPECNDKNGLIYQNGCLSCQSCGYSKCG